MPAPAPAPGADARIGPFVALRKLGEGTMGVVYAGYDVQLDRKVAIKLVHPHLLDNPEVRVRMLREAQAMARLSSPHVVHVYQVGEHGDGIYIAMEYIDGLTLHEWLRARPRPWPQILRTVCDAGRGLAAAHHAGLTHRDFKPDNILVDAEDHARVLDFGLAQNDARGDPAALRRSTLTTSESQAPELPGSTRLTQRGKTLGTPAYMSPEQHFAQPVDPLSDQYSFAITLYEALYGARPFAGDSWAEIRRQVARGVVPQPPLESRVPRRVYRALARGLAYDPGDRWPSLDALLAALEHDPWRARRRVAAMIGAIGAASTASYLAAAQAAAPPLCPGAELELTDVWDEGRRAAVARAFSATHAPFAGDVQARVQLRLDAYAAGWRDQHRAACEATAAGAQSSHLLDLRIACLGRRRTQLSALVEVFTEADRKVVEHAVQAVAGLPSVETCGDVQGLLTAVPPPSEPATAARVEALHLRLARAASLEATGHYEQGLQLAAQVRAEARSLGHAPLDAEAALVEGSLRIVAARPEEAEAALVSALHTAIAHDLHAVAAEAAAKRLFVISDGLGRPAEALATQPFAEALVERAGDDGRLAALLHNNLGAAHEQHGDHTTATRHYERALAILARGPDALDPLLVVIHHNLGGMYLDEDRLAGAREHYTRALALCKEILGAHHPLAAHPLAGIGDVDARQAAFAAAQLRYSEALALMVASYGPDHLYLLHPLAGLGRVHAARGEPAEARRSYERAVAIADLHHANHPLLAEALAGLAALASAAGEPERARVLSGRADRVRAALPAG